ncbi:unnamed protein product [Chrysoparadoxa australica]
MEAGSQVAEQAPQAAQSRVNFNTEGPAISTSGPSGSTPSPEVSFIPSSSAWVAACQLGSTLCELSCVSLLAVVAISLLVPVPEVALFLAAVLWSWEAKDQSPVVVAQDSQAQDVQLQAEQQLRHQVGIERDQLEMHQRNRQRMLEEQLLRQRNAQRAAGDTTAAAADQARTRAQLDEDLARGGHQELRRFLQHPAGEELQQRETVAATAPHYEAAVRRVTAEVAAAGEAGQQAGRTEAAAAAAQTQASGQVPREQVLVEEGQEHAVQLLQGALAGGGPDASQEQRPEVAAGLQGGVHLVPPQQQQQQVQRQAPPAQFHVRVQPPPGGTIHVQFHPPGEPSTVFRWSTAGSYWRQPMNLTQGFAQSCLGTGPGAELRRRQVSVTGINRGNGAGDPAGNQGNQGT